jgi:hypothetical protein
MTLFNNLIELNNSRYGNSSSNYRNCQNNNNNNNNFVPVHLESQMRDIAQARQLLQL